MINLTLAALSKLKTLILEHPEDPIVRLVVRDLDEERVGLNITLVSDPESEDDVQEHDGLTVALDRASGARLDGATLDYVESEGFKFLHPDHGARDLLGGMSLN